MACHCGHRRHRLSHQWWSRHHRCFEWELFCPWLWQHRWDPKECCQSPLWHCHSLQLLQLWWLAVCYCQWDLHPLQRLCWDCCCQRHCLWEQQHVWHQCQPVCWALLSQCCWSVTCIAEVQVVVLVWVFCKVFRAALHVFMAVMSNTTSLHCAARCHDSVRLDSKDDNTPHSVANVSRIKATRCAG